MIHAERFYPEIGLSIFPASYVPGSRVAPPQRITIGKISENIIPDLSIPGETLRPEHP